MVRASQLSQSLIRPHRKHAKLVSSEQDSDHLALAPFVNRGSEEGPFQDFEDVIASKKANDHCYARCGETLDQNPPQILEVLEKRFYWAALFLFLYIKRPHSGFIGHSWNRSRSSLGTGGRLGNSLRLLGFDALASVGRQALLRRRRGRRFVHRVGNLLGHFFSCFLKFFDALPQPFGKFWQFFRAKQNQNQSENENDLAASQVKKAEHNIHTRAIHASQTKPRPNNSKAPFFVIDRCE